MKSIYSLPILQRILDKFSVGKIIHVTYFQNIGSRIWRHNIETTQGEFELYSYPPEIHEYAQRRIASAPAAEQGSLFPQLHHSFDRYHQLKQFTKKFPITLKQLTQDMVVFKNQSITKIFRVYGSIIYLDFMNGSYLNSYGSWKVYREWKGAPPELIRDADVDSHEQLDFTLQELTEKKLMYESFLLQGDVLRVFLSDGYFFEFRAYTAARLEAGRIKLLNRHHMIVIFDEKEVFYEKEIEKS